MASRPVSQARVLEVLLVEDNPGDVRLIEEGLSTSRVPYRLHITKDGEQALRYLRNEEEFSGVRRPDLILLDWNLPRIGGPEVLLAVKGDVRLQDIPVVVLTSSGSPEDIAGAYDLYANCYIRKPETADQFFEVMRTVERFWLHTATLPPAR